jgi:hypothetical protein
MPHSGLTPEADRPAGVPIFQAWYDVIGVGASVFAQDYDNKYLGQYYGPTVGYPSDVTLSAASAFVQDNFVLQTN